MSRILSSCARVALIIKEFKGYALLIREIYRVLTRAGALHDCKVNTRALAFLGTARCNDSPKSTFAKIR